MCECFNTDHCPWMNNCVGANNFSKSYQTTTMQNNSVVQLIISLIYAFYRTLHSILMLHMDGLCLCTDNVWVELLFLQQ
jgi:hypothetical protein